MPATIVIVLPKWMFTMLLLRFDICQESTVITEIAIFKKLLQFRYVKVEQEHKFVSLQAIVAGHRLYAQGRNHSVFGGIYVALDLIQGIIFPMDEGPYGR